MTKIKICGIKTPDALNAAIDGGAHIIGFNHVPTSPRYIGLTLAAELARQTRYRAESAVLLVNPDDATIDRVLRRVKPDWIQLHGGESVERVMEIRKRFDIPTMYAIGVSTKDDVIKGMRFQATRCELLFDARPPEGATYPGGHGQTFDWSILQVLPRRTEYYLSGGLTPENVGNAVRTLKPYGVDVSSGVESARGVKDPALIRAFCAAVKAR
jgi:phosphoribosylanthranilate isomerase